MRIVGCGQLGKLVSKAFLTWILPDTGRIPVQINVYDGDDYSAALDLLPCGREDSEEYKDYVIRLNRAGACARRGHGNSPGEAIQNLIDGLRGSVPPSVDDYEITKVKDLRRDKTIPLGVETDSESEARETREKAERNLEEDPELLQLLSGEAP
jgi:hypothetical protein